MSDWAYSIDFTTLFDPNLYEFDQTVLISKPKSGPQPEATRLKTRSQPENLADLETESVASSHSKTTSNYSLRSRFSSFDVDQLHHSDQNSNTSSDCSNISKFTIASKISNFSTLTKSKRGRPKKLKIPENYSYLPENFNYLNNIFGDENLPKLENLAESGQNLSPHFQNFKTEVQFESLRILKLFLAEKNLGGRAMELLKIFYGDFTGLKGQAGIFVKNAEIFSVQKPNLGPEKLKNPAKKSRKRTFDEADYRNSKKFSAIENSVESNSANESSEFDVEEAQSGSGKIFSKRKRKYARKSSKKSQNEGTPNPKNSKIGKNFIDQHEPIKINGMQIPKSGNLTEKLTFQAYLRQLVRVKLACKNNNLLWENLLKFHCQRIEFTKYCSKSILGIFYSQKFAKKLKDLPDETIDPVWQPFSKRITAEKSYNQLRPENLAAIGQFFVESSQILDPEIEPEILTQQQQLDLFSLKIKKYSPDFSQKFSRNYEKFYRENFWTNFTQFLASETYLEKIQAVSIFEFIGEFKLFCLKIYWLENGSNSAPPGRKIDTSHGHFSSNAKFSKIYPEKFKTNLEILKLKQVEKNAQNELGLANNLARLEKLTNFYPDIANFVNGVENTFTDTFNRCYLTENLPLFQDNLAVHTDKRKCQFYLRRQIYWLLQNLVASQKYDRIYDLVDYLVLDPDINFTVLYKILFESSLYKILPVMDPKKYINLPILEPSNFKIFGDFLALPEKDSNRENTGFVNSKEPVRHLVLQRQAMKFCSQGFFKEAIDCLVAWVLGLRFASYRGPKSASDFPNSRPRSVS